MTPEKLVLERYLGEAFNFDSFAASKEQGVVVTKTGDLRVIFKVNTSERFQGRIIDIECRIPGRRPFRSWMNRSSLTSFGNKLRSEPEKRIPISQIF